MANPTSQKATERPIAFRLEDGMGGVTTVPLVIRPEDLSLGEPGQQSAVQTLGGAYVDNFGLGLATIQLSGHTGWGAGDRPDGVEEFKKLHQRIWRGWYEARAAMVEAGRDPSEVSLIYVDDLNELCVKVAPGQFQLKRSKSRPLLSMYQINMVVLTDRLQKPTKDPLNLTGGGQLGTVKAGLSSLRSTVSTLSAKATQMRGFIDKAVHEPLRDLTNMASQSMSQVMDVVTEARGIVTAQAAQFVSMSQDLALVGRNAFNTYNAIGGLPDFVQHDVSAVASAFNNAFCVLGNAFQTLEEFPDYDAIYGSSNCSSTVGGSAPSPLANTNPWEVILPTRAQVAAVTPEARANIEALKVADPVLRPMPLAELSSRVRSLTNGGVIFQWL